jgi:hypothetical protein
MFVCCVFCVGSDHCDKLITRSEESYRVCLIVCDLETSTMELYSPDLGCCGTENMYIYIYLYDYQIKTTL